MNVDKILKLVGPKLKNTELDSLLNLLLSVDDELTEVKVCLLFVSRR